MTTIETALTLPDATLNPDVSHALARLEADLAMLVDAGADLDGRDEPDDYAWDFHRAAVLSAHDALRDRLGHPTTPDVVDREYQAWHDARRDELTRLRTQLRGTPTR
ncbi:hypothetical protein [Nakamurella multipartita]|uniref:Uncharacterized protein n=1 Tax=Nakamurella multipartita (strain ATCC 700099 / DSM 44233 / CIP 104796 / JCM 9543 / NBRC 105858 / Y-104) TaxID=479431 RepID=C8X8H6_NAKMY|nr:hypothetical protein [Nakamurella multipartita]ACV79031.1 hypothetical protein Namu_2685 [Nakamurella multipartita DSM 44233]